MYTMDIPPTSFLDPQSDVLYFAMIGLNRMGTDQTNDRAFVRKNDDNY
jgi:hypothetical protein